ncbi:MAG: class I SAM-dependent methyltransferase [Actinomycetota bacterium]
MNSKLTGSESELRAHWDAAYADLSPTGVSWFEPGASLSLALVDQLQLPLDTPILDVGGGASTFVDGLLDRGFSHVTVVDLSEVALAAARTRLGPRAGGVEWVNRDLLQWDPGRRFGLGTTGPHTIFLWKSGTGAGTKS